MSIGIDFGIGIDENLWYRPGIVSKPKNLVSPTPIPLLISKVAIKQTCIVKIVVNILTVFFTQKYSIVY